MRFEEAYPLIPEVLSGVTGLHVDPVQVQAPGDDPRSDLQILAGKYRFLVEFKHASSADSVGAAARVLTGDRTGEAELTIPLLVVPHMGAVGRRIADAADLSWLDLSGNACIRAPGLHVRVLGRPNRFPRRGRPRTLFAPRGSRIVRRLLLSPDEHFSQRGLSRETGVDKGYTSRYVRSLSKAGLVTRETPPDGPRENRIRVNDPDLLLDAWAEAYRFDDHRIWRGLTASRSGEETLARVAEVLAGLNGDYAFTGLAAAWLYSSYAAFRLVTAYVRDPAVVAVLETAGVREQSTGANVWIAIPNDDGVLHGAAIVRGMPCVSTLQTYLDLKAHPERAAEAAAELRRSALPWSMT
ncbi:MarR family transcriptional regulator [Candidatus Palauibacter sp.]|uniref:MarR family transcriptional regulator n=1 Tax=Candidatus Palauibacter sp. TaxID=3101350 RepID=UPI003CC57B02